MTAGNVFVTGSLETGGDGTGLTLYFAAMIRYPPATGKLAVGVGDAPGLGVPNPRVMGPLLPSVVKGVGAGDGLSATTLGDPPLVRYLSVGVHFTEASPESNVMGRPSIPPERLLRLRC